MSRLKLIIWLGSLLGAALFGGWVVHLQCGNTIKDLRLDDVNQHVVQVIKVKHEENKQQASVDEKAKELTEKLSEQRKMEAYARDAVERYAASQARAAKPSTCSSLDPEWVRILNEAANSGKKNPQPTSGAVNASRSSPEALRR